MCSAMAALSVLAMFFAVCCCFKEPRRSERNANGQSAPSGQEFPDAVIANPRFMLFLVIFSGYWIVFWQEFIILPLYIHDYINSRSRHRTDPGDRSADRNRIAGGRKPPHRKMPAFRAITLGTLISALAWLILVVHPTVRLAVVTLVVVARGRTHPAAALLRIHFTPRASGQQGTYMGFAFLPIGIGSLVGGWFGGDAHASLWGSNPPPGRHLVGDNGSGRCDRGAAVDLRQDSERGQSRSGISQRIERGFVSGHGFEPCRCVKPLVSRQCGAKISADISRMNDTICIL